MNRTVKLAFLIGVSVTLLSGCAHYRVQKEISMDDWAQMPDMRLSLPLYAKYLEGVKICLDPGHGGDYYRIGYKAGPTGVREAQVNWQVAMFLEEMLEEAGAKVIITRDGDQDVSLRRRVEIANENDVDIFISMHHNAASRESANYTTTWYHADPDFAPANLDLARYLQRGVEEALHLDQTHPRGLMSDYLIYPRSGFGVLRGLDCIGCLGEASFHSNPQEEKRLANPWYNQREAYGYFLGIARYVAAGIPSSELVSPSENGRVETDQPTLNLLLNDGLSARGGWGADRNWIIQRTLQISVDGDPIPTTYDPKTKQAIGKVQEELSNGPHTATVDFQNLYMNNAPGKRHTFIVAPPAVKLVMTVEPEVIAADENAWAVIRVEAFDSDGEHVADGTEIDFSISEGELLKATQGTYSGVAYNYYRCPWGACAQITAKSASAQAQASIQAVDSKVGGVSGILYDRSTGDPLEGATVSAGPKTSAVTTPDGWFSLDGTGTPVMVRSPGYYGRLFPSQMEQGNCVWDTLELSPVGEGSLTRRAYVIDPRFGGKEQGATTGSIREADANLAVAKQVKKLLEAAGAEVHLTREGDVTLSVQERIRQANRWPSAWYVRIEHKPVPDAGPTMSAKRYPNSQTMWSFARPILESASACCGLKVGPIDNCEDPEIKETRGPASSLVFHTLDTSLEDPKLMLALVTGEAYAVYQGILAFLGVSEDANDLECLVTDSQTATALADAVVNLGGVDELAACSETGKVRFTGLPGGESYLKVTREGYRTCLKPVDLSSGTINIRMQSKGN